MPTNKIKKKSKEDKFYTRKSVADDCITSVRDLIQSMDFVLEPSSGNGAFSKNTIFDEKVCIEYDLSPPETSTATKKDFLTVDRKDLPQGNFGVIGNPPFGERNNLSKAFIKNCLEFGEDLQFIAFILPEVYSKYTLQKVFPSHWKLTQEVLLPKDSFILDGNPYHVPCVWQVWEKCGNIDLRKSAPKTVSSLFEISTKDKGSDFFIFGASPSKIIPSEDVSKNNRGYFIKSFLGSGVLEGVISEVGWKRLGKSSVNGGVSWFTIGEVISHIEEKYYEKYSRVSEGKSN